eukprot:CAMPEP_0115868202 /NCGR_PEP_ID=MMETSP0287-20121206/21171_1 /TAXON_ID=412157 /ORGANISM="Chrysochromulina rotalis, Strain UIO044" /LENGTH=107 /DNA_ID=CAMNT_0003322849 /DNA_START=185 /DNA_END=505 /DNA_ORIENTATION=+
MMMPRQLAVLGLVVLVTGAPIVEEGITAPSPSSVELTGARYNCNVAPASIETGCKCSDPNSPSNKAVCTRQTNGECRITGHDSWGVCESDCCAPRPPPSPPPAPPCV